MPEYIQYDEKGIIVKKWYSVDPSIVEGLLNILKIPRDEFKSLTRFHKVQDGKVVEMTQEEKDAILQAEQDIKDQHKTFVDGIKAKLKGLGFTDEEVDYLISHF